MRRPAWLNRQVFGWGMFDFANQAFTLVILTAFFNLYFTQYIVPGEVVVAADGSEQMDHSMGRRLWAVCGVITQVLIIVLGPIVGAMADFYGAKKKLLVASWLGAVLFTASLGLVPPGAVAAGMILFIIAYLFYGAGEGFIAAFLPEVSTQRTMGRVSAFGWTLGYIGGLLCLGGAAVFTFIWEGPAAYRLICVWAAVFFFFAALPTIILLRERKRPEAMPQGYNITTIGFHRVADTWRAIRRYRWLFQFLIVMTIYLAGMQIVIWFAGTLTRELFGFGERKMALFILQITVTAIIGALITAALQDRIGARNYILICMVFWAVTIATAAAATTEPMFWVVGNAVGLGIGALGTSSRAMAGLFTPEHKAGEFFGFYGLAHKLAAILGLSSFAVADWLLSGDLNLVAASGTVFFILGFFLMLGIDERAGRAAAIRAAGEYRRAQARLEHPPDEPPGHDTGSRMR